MGREIRHVAANWEHPRDDRGNFIPMFDQDYDSAAEEWTEAFLLWRKGEHPDQQGDADLERSYYWEWAGPPPEKKYYRPVKWTEEEACCFQVYENVTEGTPCTPVFTDKEELLEYLVKYGDVLVPSQSHGGWERAAAALFVESEYTPSFMVTPSGIYGPGALPPGFPTSR